MTAETTAPTVRVALALTSEEHGPDAITASVGLEPTGTATRGEPRRPGLPPSKQTVWRLARPETATHYVEEEVAALLDDLGGATAALAAAIDRLSLTAYVSCTVWIAEDTPALAFDHALLQRIAELGAGLDVDLYLRPAG